MDPRSTKTYLALSRAADMAELMTESDLRNGVRYRATGDTQLSDITDRAYLAGQTDARDLRATARDLC